MDVFYVLSTYIVFSEVLADLFGQFHIPWCGIFKARTVVLFCILNGYFMSLCEWLTTSLILNHSNFQAFPLFFCINCEVAFCCEFIVLMF